MNLFRKKMPAPRKKGIAHVPVVMQMQVTECGAASLAMVVAYYKKYIPLEQVSHDCGVSRDGSNALAIVKAARRYGFEVQAYRMEPAMFRENGEYPCIIHWNRNHFVVLCGFIGNNAVINDPAEGCVRVPREEFDRRFTGICVMLTPGEGFEPGGTHEGMLHYAWRQARGAGRPIVFLVTVTLLVGLLGLTTPLFTRILYDRLLPGYVPDWVQPFLLIFAGVIAAELLLEFLKARYAGRMRRKMRIVGGAEYMWHVLRLPMIFFSQRHAGDITQRRTSGGTVENTIVDTLTPLGVNIVMMVLYLVIMLRYNVVLTLVGVAAMLLALLTSQLAVARRIRISRGILRDSGNAESAALAGIGAIETIKSSGSEMGFFANWAGYQANVAADKAKLAKLDNYLGTLPGMLVVIADALVLVMGIFLILKGDLTEGGLLAFQSILSSFTTPAMSIINAGQTLQDMRTTVERVEDVMNFQEDEVFSADDADEGQEFSKLSGKIEFKNVTFGYDPLSKPLIEDFSATVPAGGRIAFVGASGCGKSTLARLLLGLNKPWSGEVLFDGKKQSDIPRGVFTASVAMVDQDITIFEGTFGDNIRLWDGTIEDFEVILAARDAQVHEMILEHEGGYDSKLSEDARNLSGGQRQCLEIARVLAQDPTVLVLDEATSALDAETEYRVMNAIRDRGITLIIIAHRLSTIRDADEIIVLDHGKVAERGTHEELIGKNGVYCAMVKEAD